ncbi:MAG: hypothetical protein AAFU77_09605 [Myxococcota bacterium]
MSSDADIDAAIRAAFADESPEDEAQLRQIADLFPRRSRWRAMMPVAVTVAVAASVMLVFALPRSARYTLEEPRGWTQLQRGPAPSESHRLAPDGELRFRVIADTEREFAVAVFVAQDHRWRRVPVQTESEHGIARVLLRGAEAFGDAFGEWRVHVRAFDDESDIAAWENAGTETSNPGAIGEASGRGWTFDLQFGP